MKRAGINVVAAFDNWTPAIECYRGNLAEHPILDQDLSQWEEAVEAIKSYSFDLIIGGPPCQDFSDAGNRVEGDKAELTLCFAKIVSALKPSYFIMENVSGARSSVAFGKARKIFKKAGYGLTEQVLDASYCGVPQRRKRFFCIGSIMHNDAFLATPIAVEQTALPMTLKDYWGDSAPIEFYYRHPRTYGRRAIFSIDEPAPTIRGCNRPMPQGYQRHPKDAAPSLNGIRAMDVAERAMVQTFPNNYVWTGAASIDNQLIGNAVPVELAHFVGKCLLKFHNHEYSDSLMSFTDWLQQEKKYTDRAASDVLSRYRRALLLLEKKDLPAMVDIVAVLENSASWVKISKSVRTQLKRACVLHREYLTTTETRSE